MEIKITLEVELEDVIDVTDEEQKLWLENEILIGDGTLKLHSEDIGDTVGIINKVSSVIYLTPSKEEKTNSMEEFKKYRRTQIAEMQEVTQEQIDFFKERGVLPCGNLTVSISDADLTNGSPKIGDMIARNPKNNQDQWLVAEQYFKDNFESTEL